MSRLASAQVFEAYALAEKEGFEPSFPSKSHGNRLGFLRDDLEHGS